MSNSNFPPSGAEIVQLALTGVSIASSADTARAISLRGVFAMCAVHNIAMCNGFPVDDFEQPWEALAPEVQSGWLTVARYVDKLAHTPGWSGTLGGGT